MKKIKHLFMALLTLITFNSFSQTTYTVTQTNNIVSCLSNDYLTFQDLSAGSIKTLYVNGSQVGSPFTSSKTVTVSTTFTAGVNMFSVMCSGSTSWNGTITVNAATGVSELSNTFVSELVVFPNPTKDFISIKDLKTANITVSDVVGKQVINKEFINEDVKLSIADLPQGIYYIEIKTNTKKSINKIIKE